MIKRVLRKPPAETFWVTNISNRNVTLSDLALNIKAFTTVNLLDSKHYSYTKEQLEKSAASGSLFVKRHLVKKRVSAPHIEVKPGTITMLEETFIPSRERSVLSIKEEHYDELKVEEQRVDDEKFAAENAELADLDTQLQLIKRQK